MSAVLKPPSELSETDRITVFIKNWVTFDSQTGVYLYRSYGRRKYGRPTRYCVVAKEPDDYKCFTAWTQEEAIEKANTWLAKQEAK